MEHKYEDLVVIPKSTINSWCDCGLLESSDIDKILQETVPLTPIVENAYDAGVDQIDILELRDKERQEFIKKGIEF